MRNMLRKSWAKAAVALLAALPLALCGADGAATGGNGLSRAFQRARPVGSGAYSVSGGGTAKGKGIEQLLKEMGDDEVLIRIGNDELKWGLVRRHVEALCSGINRLDMQAEGDAAIKSIAFQTRLRKLLKEYVEHAVFAVEARRTGIEVGQEVFDSYREKARSAYAKMGDAGKALLGLMNEGECFYEHNLTNALYWQAYRDRVLLPLVGAEEDEVARMADMVKSANSSAVATNLQNRILISNILSRLRGGMEFGDAAEKWSDCESSVTRGVMMDGLDEHPARFASGDLPEQVENAIDGLKEGEFSGIIETPFDWRIVRLLKRNASAGEEEPTVEIAQITLEKKMLAPELTPAQARAKVEAIKMKAVLKVKFRELLDSVKIDSKIPLWESSDPNKRSVSIKRLK